MPRNLDKSIRGEGTAFEIDPPEPDWLDPPRPCGHEWRNNDFVCMDCVEARIADLERDLAVVRAAPPPAVPCKICGALPDVIGTPVEDCDVFDYLARCSNDDCGYCPTVIDKETAITIWNSNNSSLADTRSDNPPVAAALARDHCWHKRRGAVSFCCDCEGLRDAVHVVAAPKT